MNDDYRLQRFAQAQAPVYDNAIAILRDGMMCTPWMDFIFPRLAGTGQGTTRFAIASLDEARAYLAFPLLGNRYRECVEALTWSAGRTAGEVFGPDDAGKLHASLTLFAEATNEQLMRIMLSVWYRDMVDERTMAQLQEMY